ncbi:MAG: pyridoxal phosphate-dependent aminotransferase [Bacteroidales bacterium]|mgnify:FL=1|nr:pyridoxal phosphate-dependent aminotransferase [Lentimicrobiaceae bacterium]MBQ2908097.1 pyridoxal phosphate-dependent aminotransferase [Bacteroidales bacterium]MBQ3593936.1 pyridoxal phosphate-dependent aminotransferase [Bacteroidales bacterium]
MPSISKKAQNMPASPIRKLVPFSDAAKKRGIEVFHLNIGQPDIETPNLALEAVRNYTEKVVKYSPSEGTLSYRKKLCEYYEKYDIHILPEEMIITTGGSEALLMTFLTIMDPDDEVIIPEPFYANYNGFAKNVGVNVKPIYSSIDTGFALPDISEFEKAITPRTKAILICNPNNPTGYLYSEEEMETLRQIVLKHDIFLISDEVYREFCYEDAIHHSALKLKGIEDHVILIDSASKRFSACGIRIGRMITKNKELLAAAMKFAQARLSPPTFGQVAGEAALDSPQSYYDEIVREYESRRDVCIEGIKNIEGAYCPTPKGAFYIVAHLPIDDSERFCKWMLTDYNYNGKTVMMAPASGFYSTEGRGKQEVRISYCLKKEDLKEAMAILKEALLSYPGRTL